MDYSQILNIAGQYQLEIYGGFHPKEDDKVPAGTKTLIMLGPKEPGFWQFITSQDEFRNNLQNPMDQWSKRVINLIGENTGGKPYYPFGGPPYHPFLTWALKTGRSWQSPVQFLVHDTAGLLVSYRGALAYKDHITLPKTPNHSPCVTCSDKPCISACPVDVLTPNHYDANGCRTYVSSEEGYDCLTLGCNVRRICPVSQRYQRNPKQSEFHQIAFLNNAPKT